MTFFSFGADAEPQLGGAMSPTTSIQRWCMGTLRLARWDDACRAMHHLVPVRSPDSSATPMSAGSGTLACDARSGKWVVTPGYDSFACVGTARRVLWASSFGPTSAANAQALAVSGDGQYM